MKLAIFQVVDNGIDGREKTRVIYSSLCEISRNSFFESSKNKAWLRKVDIVGDLESITRQFFNKLDGNDLMILELAFNYDYHIGEHLSFPHYDTNITLYKGK